MTKAVHKFGGSSLSSAERYKAVVNIIENHCKRGDLIVVSAAGKTTDTLVKLWQSREQGDAQAVEDLLGLLKQQQLELILELLSEAGAHELAVLLQGDIDTISQKLREEVSEAWLLAYGEIWSARLLAAALCDTDFSAKDIDARNVFIEAGGELQHTENRQRCLQALTGADICVVTGFIAADPDGNTVTLGRNGSDYSATLLARYSDAGIVSVWTDTQGVFSTDPRKVSTAVKYPKICRSQAQTLARLGNPVLHAKTLSPLKNTQIRLQVRSSFAPDAEPTEIVPSGYCKAKRFISALEEYDLIQVECLKPGEVGALSRLVQHTILHFYHQNTEYILVPSAYTHTVISSLAGRARIADSNLYGVAVVAESAEVDVLCQQAGNILKSHDVAPVLVHCGQDFALLLCEQEPGSDILSALHTGLIRQEKEVALIVAGVGNVGTEFIAQFENQARRLTGFHKVKLVGLLRSEKMLFLPSGINTEAWQQQWHLSAQDYTTDELLACLSELDYTDKLVIDMTASDAFSELYPAFVETGCHLISANKYAGTARLEWLNSLKCTLENRRLQWRYNTSVGAGLPVNFALKDLQCSGDKVTAIQGVFSGTLSWLCGRYDGSQPFSELVLEAKQLGYTEPDPREDLSGRDVQRKLLIVAREIGVELELRDIELDPLMPQSLSHGNWQDFIARRAELDAFIEAKAVAAREQNKVLRYVGSLSKQNGRWVARVGLSKVEKGNALAGLKPGDNMFVINSRWYSDNALVIQGPGAGKEVTAGGVHSDLYWMLRDLGYLQAAN